MLRFFDFLRPPRLLPAALFAVCMLSAPAVYCQPALYCDQAVRLLSIDNTGFDNFGSSVDVDGDFAVVGARAHATAAGMTGAAHIFVRSGGSWVEDAKLTPSDGVAGDLFGQSVAISGDTAVVGAFWHATNGFLAGAAYVYVRDPVGGGWTEEQKLLPPTVGPGDQFGWDVAIDGDTIAVAANADGTGSVHIFDRSVMVWTEQVVLTPMDGAVLDGFGSGVAFEGETLIVGSPDHAHAGVAEGGAYVFVRSPGGVWAEEAELIASDTALDDGFGWGVAVSGDLIVVGASYHDAGGMNAGAAYLFRGAGATWTEEAKLQASTPRPSDFFGRGVDVEGGRVVVGAPTNDLSDPFGFVYYFVGSGGVWSEEDSFQAAGGTFMDWFGGSVALDRGTVVVGAHLRDDLGPNSGAAFVFECLDDPDEDPFPSDAFVNVTTTPAEDDTFKDGIESEASLLLPQALHDGQSSLRDSYMQKDQTRDRYKHRKHVPPKVKLQVTNLTRDRDTLNWIRLDARGSEGRNSAIRSYLYAVMVEDTGRYVHAPAATASPVAHVMLPSGDYSASVTVTDSLGARRTRTKRLHISGDAVGNRSYGNIEWALEQDWKIGDESILISHPTGLMAYQVLGLIFSGEPRSNPAALGTSLQGSGGGCGSVMNNGGNGIGIATGLLSLATAGASAEIKTGVAGVSGLANATGAGLKIAGGNANSSCLQNNLDAINQQLAYQEEQIQDLYTIIGRDEEAFFSALQAISAITSSLVTISYTDAKDTMSTDFSNFMVDAGLWDSDLDPSGPWLTGPTGNETELSIESGDLVACTQSEPACCVYPEEDTHRPSGCELLENGEGPYGKLAGNTEPDDFDINLKHLSGSDVNGVACVDEYDCWKNITSNDNSTLRLVFDNYATQLKQAVKLCTADDAAARSYCPTAATGAGSWNPPPNCTDEDNETECATAEDAPVSNNIVPLFDQYNDALAAIFIQSVYSLSQAHAIEQFINLFNYESHLLDDTNYLVSRGPIDSFGKKVKGTWYHSGMVRFCKLKPLPLVDDPLQEMGAINRSPNSPTEHDQAFNCAQQQLALAYAKRFNILYTTTLNYIISDRPIAGAQAYPTESLSPPAKWAEWSSGLNWAPQYDVEIGKALPSFFSGARTPIDIVGRKTGTHNDSPDGSNWINDSALYQSYHVTDAVTCLETLIAWNDDGNNIDTDIANAFTSFADCPSIFALYDHSGVNEGFYDGKTLQPYSYKVSPGSGDSCPSACNTCMSGARPLEASADWKNSDNGSWSASCITTTAEISGFVGNQENPPQLCATCNDISNQPQSSCAVCTNARWFNNNGILFCEDDGPAYADWVAGGLGLGPDLPSDYWDTHLSFADNGTWATQAPKCSSGEAVFSGNSGDANDPPTLCTYCLTGGVFNFDTLQWDVLPVEIDSCATCSSARWYNRHGILSCEWGDSTMCRGFCSSGDRCGDYRYALDDQGQYDSNAADCRQCGSGPLLALSAPMPSNISLCVNDGITPTYCADEGGTCSFVGSADVFYGKKYANDLAPNTVPNGSGPIATFDQMIADPAHVEMKGIDGSIGCTNDEFDDPAVGFSKQCYYAKNGNQMSWYTPPPASAGNGAGLQPGLAYLSCGHWKGIQDVVSGAEGVGIEAYMLEHYTNADVPPPGGVIEDGKSKWEAVWYNQGTNCGNHKAYVTMTDPVCSPSEDNTLKDATRGTLNCDPQRLGCFQESDGPTAYGCNSVRFDDISDAQDDHYGVSRIEIDPGNTATGEKTGGPVIPIEVFYQCSDGNPYECDDGSAQCTHLVALNNEEDVTKDGSSCIPDPDTDTLALRCSLVDGRELRVSLEDMYHDAWSKLTISTLSDVGSDPKWVARCAESDGDFCPCGGTVYYGKKYVNTLNSSVGPGSGEIATFEEMLSDPARLAWPAVEKPGLSCDPDSFGGAPNDPAPNFFKQCFCASAP